MCNAAIDEDKVLQPKVAAENEVIEIEDSDDSVEDQKPKSRSGSAASQSSAQPVSSQSGLQQLGKVDFRAS